jgi:hypothetical protein
MSVENESTTQEVYCFSVIDLLKIDVNNPNNNLNIANDKTKEIVSKNMQQLLHLTIIDLLKMAIHNPDNNMTITLSDNSKELILKLLETNQSVFSDVVCNIFNIIQDNKIDTKDIPNLIQLLQKIYEVAHNTKAIKLDKSELALSCGIIIKFIINMLVEQGHIKISEERKSDFFVEIYNLIDTCVSLIQLTKSLKPPSCLKKLLHRK